MNFKTFAFTCVIFFNLPTIECDQVLKRGEINGVIDGVEFLSVVPREVCGHLCVCASRREGKHSCICLNCPCCGECYDCQCCDCGTIYSGRLGRQVCEACNCRCGEEWNPDVAGQRRCIPCDESFPGTARLFLENGTGITMSELQVGDRVQTVSSDGHLIHSEVRTFMEKRHNVTSMYKLITTILNNTILLTGNHPLYARKMSTEKFSPMYAHEVSIGDEVLAMENKHLTTTKVINVSSLIMEGAYVPLTMEGTIMVDGILASCYPSADHNLAHIAMTPMRWFPWVIEQIYGEGNGFPGYVEIANFMGRLTPYQQQYKENSETCRRM